jgi:hypothetical protein
MRTVIALVLALLTAITLPALAMIIPYASATLSVGDDYGWLRTRNFSFLAVTVSAGHVLLLGIPTFLVLKWKNAIYWWSSALAGFVLGSVPLGIAIWPLQYMGSRTTASHGDGEKVVYTLIDGVPTLARWIEYVQTILFMGTLGALGGVAFWLVWRSLRRRDPPLKPQTDPVTAETSR